MSENRIKLVDYLIAEGEDEIKGRHRMIYKIRDVFWTNTSNKLKIEVADDKYSIINKETNEILIPPEYDNIFIYGEELFVLYKGGKTGAVRISEHNDLKVQWIANCEYDTSNNQCILRTSTEQRGSFLCTFFVLFCAICNTNPQKSNATRQN